MYSHNATGNTLAVYDASDGKTMISADGLRQFRPPSFKPKLGKTQANFEWRNVNQGQWQGNGHLDILGNQYESYITKYL